MMAAISMRSRAAIFLSLATLGIALVWIWAAASAAQSEARERARVVLFRNLPKLNGDHLRVSVVEVRYGPGESSSHHSHPCPVVGYVVEGAYRSQVKGEPEAIYKTGESFYEARNGVHLVSANASATEPVKFLAYFICDHDTPLSVPEPDSKPKGGK
jgi:quercetin dioxygenase-like cupin family protein